MFTRLLVFSFGVAFLVLFSKCAGKRWEYEPLSVEVTTSDPTKLNIEATMERLGRDECTFTSTLEWNYDTDETTMVEASAYRSTSGSEDDYVLLPWSIPKQTYKQYTDSYYKNIVFKNFENCSNLPQPDNVDPWPRSTYKLNQCVANGDGMPEVMPEGYYKVIFSVTGEVDWSLTAIVKVIKTTDILG